MYFCNCKKNINRKGPDRKRGGMTIVETMFYIVLLTIVFSAIVSTVLAISKSYRQFRSSAELQTNGAFAFDRLVRETRNSNSIDVGQSVFGINPGRLFLNAVDDSGSPYTLDFYTSGSVLNLKKNGVLIGPLTASTTAVTNLIFRKIESGPSTAVKIEATLRSTDGQSREANFYTTVILQGSY